MKALLKKDVSDLEWDMLTLPARMGGLGICKPTEACLIAHTNSVYISSPLVRLIKRQEFDFDPRELSEEVQKLRADVDKEADARFKEKLGMILEAAPPELKKAVEAASEKGASSWVTAMPNYDHGTVLHKGEFVDACYIRYGWTLLDLPLTCACGAPFNVQHALGCALGGLRTIQQRHDCAVYERSWSFCGGDRA